MTEKLNIISIYHMPEVDVFVVEVVFQDDVEIKAGDKLIVRHEFHDMELPNVEAHIERNLHAEESNVS